jgi:hypothetical protein
MTGACGTRAASTSFMPRNCIVPIGTSSTMAPAAVRISSARLSKWARKKSGIVADP